MKYYDKKLYCVVTFGCQMNVHESEKIRGILSALGMRETNSPEEADVVVFNTCCIREGAEDRAYNNVCALKKSKQENPNKIIAICGCMPQQKDGKYDLKKRLPFVDIVLGTHNVLSLKTHLEKIATKRERVVEILESANGPLDLNDCVRDDKINAYVNIIYGCNKFCTYCIVPYVRGREKSRPADEIYAEVKDLVQNKGYKFITLLGQNVNSYGKDLDNPMTFASLLKFLCEIEGDFKIKFMTSHPMDFSDELIEVMKSEDKMAKYLHLPVQSGSSKILSKMNRHYDAKHYKTIINKVKRAIPNIALSTDIIVGFPNETEKDFMETMKLIKKVKYDQIFAFMYSKRKGTPASVMENQVDEDIKNERINRLLTQQKIIQKDQFKKNTNRVYNCLILQRNGVAVGLTDGGKEIYIPNYKFNNENYFANVRVEDIRNHKLSGVIL